MEEEWWSPVDAPIVADCRIRSSTCPWTGSSPRHRPRNSCRGPGRPRHLTGEDGMKESSGNVVPGTEKKVLKKLNGLLQ